MPIRVLDKHVAELIAAGEVVERPSSVIKELVENSIDAGATQITVEIKRGGVAYMRITDDGCGIPHDEVPTAFKRHATSKVWSESDLVNIGTLGFRGEALASVCAVARVDMLTAAADGEGTAYSIHGGDEVKYDDSGCPKGTTIIVRDLFYNTPARMKFLKKDASEATAVAGVMDRMALSHPEIAFRFINEGKVQMQTQGGCDIASAVYSVFGRDFASGLIPVEYSNGSITLTGLICRPAAARKSRGMQLFFINGRYVNSRTMRAALEQAYRGSIMVGCFPSCVLFINMRSDEVDINVHPAKLECRFTNEKPVFDCVYYGVKSALHAGDTRGEIKLHSDVSAPAVKLPQATQLHLKSDARPIRQSTQVHLSDMTEDALPPRNKPLVMRENEPYMPSARRDDRLDILVDDEPEQEQEAQLSVAYTQNSEADSVIEAAVASAPNPEQSDEIVEPEAPDAESVISEEASSDGEQQVDIKLIGEAFSTYIIAESGSELIIIDKHAAHERIIYERLRANSSVSSQMLLEPAAVTLSKEEFAAILSNLDKISDAGFEMEDFGGSSVLVRAVPTVLAGSPVNELVTEIAAGFLENKNAVEIEQLDWLYHNIACRAAVKGGDRSGPEDLIVLARRVALGDDIRYCPHGRPVAYKLTRKELEKQFGRLG